MTDRLKFIKDIESRAIGPSRDRTRRSLDAFDELQSENSRLRRELTEVKEENRQLKERLDKASTPVTKPPVASSPVVAEKTEEPKDDATIRFSLLDLK